MTDRKQDIVERLTDRAASYRLGGQSSEHTATMLDEAAAEIVRLRSVARQAWDTIDCLLIYATTYPGDSHPREAVAFARALAKDIGIQTPLRVGNQFRDVRHEPIRPYPAPPCPSAPGSVE